jgi:hypothetical protein
VLLRLRGGDTQAGDKHAGYDMLQGIDAQTQSLAAGQEQIRSDIAAAETPVTPA